MRALTEIQIESTAASLPALVDRASQALAQARSSAEVLDARDHASFAYDVAKRAARMAEAKGAHDSLVAAAHRAQADALEIEVAAKRRLADEYDAAQERGEIKKAGNPNSSHTEELPGATDVGLSYKEVYEARQVRDAEVAQPGITRAALDGALAAGDEPTRAEVKRVAEAVTKVRAEGLKFASAKEAYDWVKADRAKQAETRRDERIANLAEISKSNRALDTSQRYPVIYADPPWRYENPPMGASSRSIENHYPTMTLDEICALPVADLATDDAILYLWATAPKLAECMAVIESWGFVYRTNFVWVKDKVGMGYHARSQHEILIVAKRGNIPPPAVSDRVASVVFADRGPHSEKPPIFYDMIESFYPTLPRIELFCRSPRLNWAVWGNQSEAA